MFAYGLKFRKYRHDWVIALLIAGIAPFAFTARAQSSNPDVNEIVSRASAEKRRYAEEFRNLLAKETKRSLVFDKAGKLKKERVIVSNFLVYEFLNRKGAITEFRSVISVDGKPIPTAEKRAEQIFERVSKADSVAAELERIQKESLRYDDDFQIVGLALFQAIALDARVRDLFEFKAVGREIINGRAAYVLRYEQVKQSDLISVSDRPEGSSVVLSYQLDLDRMKNPNARLTGKLWIDAKSYQIVRENRQLSIKPDGFETPIVIASDEFAYSFSDFGIHTPRRIAHLQFRVDPKTRHANKELEYLFTYSDFARPTVEVTSNKRAQP